jgi:transmembrane sensor
MNRRDQIEAEAAGWLARVDRGLDSEEEILFARWKGADIEHRIVYQQLQAVWRRADRLAVLRQPSHAISHRPRPLSRGLLVKAAAIAAVLVICVGVGLSFQAREVPLQRFETAVGAQRSLELADGTHVELNTDTVIHASLTSKTRTVTLDRGQAYFEVVHDANHPFVVIAGDHRITDLGTKFSVKRDGDRVTVVVKEGEVRVERIADDHIGAPVVAERNMVVIARRSETLIAMKPAQEIDNAMLWRSGMLFFNQEPLAVVAEDINRYNVRKLEVVGPARDIRIGGSFRSDNIEGFTQLLRDGFGLKVVETDDKVVISN